MKTTGQAFYFFNLMASLKKKINPLKLKNTRRTYSGTLDNRKKFRQKQFFESYGRYGRDPSLTSRADTVCHLPGHHALVYYKMLGVLHPECLRLRFGILSRLGTLFYKAALQDSRGHF